MSTLTLVGGGEKAMPSPGASVQRRSVVRAALSDEAISPHKPPGPRDAFQLLVEGATEYAVFALSPDGVVCTWNRGAERMKGYRPDEIIGKHFSVFYPTEERRAAVPDRELVDAMVDGMVSVQGWRVRQNGSRFWANVTITPLWDRAGQLRGFAKLTRDETDHHATEQLRDQLTRIEEQERIAATLADTTVRRLYAMGLRLASALKMATDSHQAQKIEAAILEADIAINEMRTTVFESWRL